MQDKYLSQTIVNQATGPKYRYIKIIFFSHIFCWLTGSNKIVLWVFITTYM